MTWFDDKLDWNVEEDWAGIGFVHRSRWSMRKSSLERERRKMALGQKKKKCNTVMCWGMIG